MKRRPNPTQLRKIKTHSNTSLRRSDALDHNPSIEMASIDTLKPSPRTHSKKQIRQLANSMEQFGFTAPIIVDENNVILAGHGRFAAAKLLRLQRVPVVPLTGLSEVERRAYLLADNKLADQAGWDRSALAVELTELAPLLIEAGLDIDLTGFEPAEIDLLMGTMSIGKTTRPTRAGRSQKQSSVDRAIYGCSTSIACSAAILARPPT